MLSFTVSFDDHRFETSSMLSGDRTSRFSKNGLAQRLQLGTGCPRILTTHEQSSRLDWCVYADCDVTKPEDGIE